MFPAPLIGLLAAGSTLLFKCKILPRTEQIRFELKKTLCEKKQYKTKSYFETNPIMALFKKLNTLPLPKFKRSAKVDYNSIVKEFIPEDGVITVPKFPQRSKEYQFVDIDNDSDKEIVVSYKQRDELKTIILKQQEEKWNKVFEIAHAGYSGLHFRSLTALSDDGKKTLLVGLQGNNGRPKLYGYSFQGNDVNEAFNRSYDRLEIMPGSKKRNETQCHQLAIWEKNDEDIYNIDLLCMRDNHLESTDNLEPYYVKRVVPHYLKLIKKAPNNAMHWYNLSDVLVSINSYNDARMAIDIGSKLDTTGKFIDRFNALRSKIH